MRTRASLKEEWLTYSGLDHCDNDRWLRDKIAALFDIEQPSEAHESLLRMADLCLTLADLPAGAYPDHKAELMLMAQSLFGVPPTTK
jgi:hypothetical protein